MRSSFQRSDKWRYRTFPPFADARPQGRPSDGPDKPFNLNKILTRLMANRTDLNDEIGPSTRVSCGTKQE